MNKKPNKKKIAASVTSVTLVVATLVALVPTALASQDRSLEYIELLKQNPSLKILEIAPTENDGVIGYYVKDSEPIANWKEKAAMLTSPGAREKYVNNDVNTKLLDQGIMSRTANAAPLYLEDMYDESYPWEIDDPDGYNVLNLDNDEPVKVRGRIEETDPGKGDYTSNDIYVPVENLFKNYFDYATWRTTLGETLREKLGDNYEVDKFRSTKILAVDKNQKNLTVFGSTATNWAADFSINPSAMLYDLASVYDKPEYYSIELEENKDKPGYFYGGSFIISFDADVRIGKGQISVVPYDEDGDIVKYSPNVSKQYWLRQENIKSGHYEFKFNVPDNSPVKYLQVRFDVDRLEAAATFSNVSIYKYNNNYFDISKWSGNGTSITKNGNVINVSAKNSEPEIYGAAENVSGDKYFIECDKYTLYSLTYHTEIMPGSGKSRVYVYGYDDSGKIIGNKTTFIPEATQYKKDSGTYTVDFDSGNAKYIAVVFTLDSTGINGNCKAYYSHISLTRALDYAKQEVVATHRQVIDHFESGDVGLEYGSNIFNFHEWYDSASYDKSVTSEMNSSVVADETNGIITVTNKGGTATSDVFKATNNMYYIAVEDASKYHLSYTANSSSKAPHNVKIVYCDDKKNKMQEDTFTFTPEAAGPYEYALDFTTLTDCRWIQVSFENTENEQRNVFSSINLCKNEAPKVYYYNLIFTKIPSINAIESMVSGTPIYTPIYSKVGTAGSFTDFKEGEKYYIFNEYSDAYEAITDFSKVSSGTAIYKFSGIYDYVGKAGDKGLTFNVRREYFTAEINYDGFISVSDPSVLGVGTVYYLKDDTSDEYIAAGIVNESTSFDGSKQYYIETPIIKDTKDDHHPYWAVSNSFEPIDDYTALFTRKSDGYKYVGENNGDYKLVINPSGEEEVIISTPLIYYKGGIINNEWFKKGVLNCSENEMNNISVSVTTVSPTYLNSLDEESLTYFVQGYELFVISYGGVDGTVSYQEDISANVRSALLKEANDTWETISGSGEEVTTAQYKIPVLIDGRVCAMTSEKDKTKENFVNLPGLANELCKDITASGGVDKYVYKFDKSDVGINIPSIVNSSFLNGLRISYTDTSSSYYPIYKEIIYENFIRSANKNKYNPLDTTVSEAAGIRYILNYRGQRIQHYKEKIRILEIQPYTEKSELLDTDGRIKPNVKQWFSPSGDMTYVDENNEVKEIDIEVTTMALGELAAKNGSIVENNDVIYIGSSLENMNLVGDRNGGTKLDDTGRIIPDYRDNNLDGKYYTSTGDLVETGADKTGYRAPLAGLVGTDYKAFRDIKILGLEIGGIFEGGALDLWYVDASDCELRKSGNDMTVNIKKQLEAFADSGRPIIYSDDLVENEYVGAFTVDMTYEIAGWDEKANNPIIRFTADLNTNGNELPEGVQPYFDFHCITGDNKVAAIDASAVKQEDVDGDGINEGVYEFVFKEGDGKKGFGNYYANVTFRFSKSKYKGLREISNLRTEVVKLAFEDIDYTLRFTSSMKHNLQEVTAVFELKGNGYMPNLYSNGGQNHIFDFVWKSRSFGGTYGRAHTQKVEYSPDPFTPNSGYDPNTCKTITTTVTFDEKRYDYQLSLYVDEADENNPTLQIYYATLKHEKDEDSIRYFKFDPMGDGTSITSASGIALNNDAFDNSSYTFECMNNVFKNYQNIFSETMLNTNNNLERNNLIKYANLSAPELVMTRNPVGYPTPLENSALEFEFKILNYTDDTISTTRYKYEFYVDNNSDGKFSANELTDANVFGAGNSDMTDNLKASTEEKENIYKFYKKFPEATSGIVPWKFIIIKVGDEVTEATTHISTTQYAYIKPSAPTLVTAVQILPADWSSDYISLGDNSGKSDLYMGSVFLSDVFVANSLLQGSDHLPLTRVINYGIYDSGTFIENKSGTANKKYGEDIASVKSANSGKTVVPSSVDFTIGTDFTLNISFKNVVQVNNAKSQEDLYNELNAFDMLILGFGDSYGRHSQVREAAAGVETNEGFQQSAVKVIERLIDEGKATLFCHDTASQHNNYVGYIANDIANTFSEIGDSIGDAITKIKNWFKRLFGSEDLEPEKLHADLHSSRVKQGYYLNIGLRDKLGLDRYGVTKNIKDRIVARDSYNSYNEIEYSNENLRDGYDYATIYYDGRKSDVAAIHTVNESFNSEMIWNKGKTMTVGDRIGEYLNDGYDIAYVPGSNRQKVDVFFQGYTDFMIDRYRSGDNIEDDAGPVMTDKITQINSGQITNYPYEIDIKSTYKNDRKDYGTLDISPTHDQVYQVSLQVDDSGNGTTVWYALANTETKFNRNYNSFRNNATNGYFIYTHKNVTYTGSGHSNTFTEAEAKLFINTIVAAYRIVADKPVINFVTPDGTTVINYQTFTSTSGSNGAVVVEGDNVYFKIKDTSVDSEATKSLGVKFYLTATPVKDEEGNITSYTYSDEVGSLTGIKGNSVASFRIPEDESEGEEKILNKLAESETNEIKIYAVPSSTLTGFAGKTETVYGDHATLTLRELNLRTLV